MTNVAIIGFGVVGGGVADLITKNSKEVSALGGDSVNIKYILDLRDFPDSPFSDRIIHDFKIIENDPEINTVIEVMGGSHPAYEFTVAALSAKKNVITSNKEVVANYGDEFLSLAKKMGVSYRFEAAVGGGIPVISPLISFIKQNRISEVRGILNGTTNYILTKMFSLGDTFESALLDAQKLGYAERNPDADILGIDASRKISILAAIVTGKLISPDNIHTEGITNIRKADVLAAEKLGLKIKLVGRCITRDGNMYIMVAPFMLGTGSSLSCVSGVYNAVEVLGEPIGNVMFYGQGAGAGATSSAVVGDLMQIMCEGTHTAAPVFKKSSEISDFSNFSTSRYVSFSKDAEDAVRSVFTGSTFINTDECTIITESMSERDYLEALEKLSSLGFAPLSHIRLL